MESEKLMPCRCGGNAFMSNHQREGSEYAAYEIKCEKCGKHKRWNYHMSYTDQGKQDARARLSERWNSEVASMTTSEPTTGEITTRLYGWIAKAGHQERCRDELLAINALTSQEQTIAALTARAEQAEKERDAAVEHVHDAIFGTNHSCFYCTMENCDGCTNSTVKEHFKYRMEKPSKYMTKIED